MLPSTFISKESKTNRSLIVKDWLYNFKLTYQYNTTSIFSNYQYNWKNEGPHYWFGNQNTANNNIENRNYVEVYHKKLYEDVIDI